MKLFNKFFIGALFVGALFTACDDDSDSGVSDVAMSPVYHLTEMKAMTPGAKPEHRITCFKKKDIVLVWKDNKAVKSYKPINYQDASSAEDYDLSFILAKDTLYYQYNIKTVADTKNQVHLSVVQFDADIQETTGDPVVFSGKVTEGQQLVEK